jgi:glycyl-tRNA synthetase
MAHDRQDKQDIAEKMEKIVSLCKRRGFIFQGSEIYGGLAGTWDYGPLGVALKNNIKNSWWKRFVSNRSDMYGLDAALLMNQRVWETSGHVGGFSDPMVECVKCKRRFRADQLESAGGTGAAKCPECGGALGEERQFNMMFKTHVGASEDATAVSYLRPETAQGIFVNFKNVMDSFHPKLPFGIAQIGRAFRNEIAPRDFLFRTREFEQMEIEYFVRPGEWKDHFEAWRAATLEWFASIGLVTQHIHEVEVPDGDRAHYSKRTIDVEFDFPFGKKELCGLAYRTDFDLSRHAEASGADLSYFDEEAKERFVPHVIEPSFGLDRTVLAILSDAYTEDELGGEPRTFLKLAFEVAPVKVAVFPLLKNKPQLVEKAKAVHAALAQVFDGVMFDDNGNIGKRYRRQDEIGTPFCVTIDFDTLEDDTVTIRDRNTGEQKRVPVAGLADEIRGAMIRA